MNLKPGAPIPAPLQGDAIPSFTHYSIVTRLPDIARRTLAENHFDPQVNTAIQQLIGEIPAGPIRPVHVPLAPDAALWDEYVRPYLGKDWLSIPWFFVEMYFYERMLEATGYFVEGAGRGVDPYGEQKRLGLASTMAETRKLCALAAEVRGQANQEFLERLLLIDLWGNQNDLSLWPVKEAAQKDAGGEESKAENSPELRSAREHILTDDSARAVEYLAGLRATGSRVDFMIDNAGYELVCDLVFADVLLGSELAEQVVFHLKPQPTFVSDAMEKDVYETVNMLARDGDAHVAALATRLLDRLQNGRLRLQSHPFWVSPYAMWQMPVDLYRDLSAAHLVISKGDAHYRRLLGDRHWSLALPFEQVVSYLPGPALALRTMKSEIAVGIQPAKIPSDDPDWMSDGRWGLVEFAPLHKESKSRV